MFQNIIPRCRYLCVSNIISDEHSGSLVCDSCGLVAEDRVLDVGVEWPTFSVDGWLNSTKLSLDNTCGSIISSMGRTTKYRQKLRYLSQYQKSHIVGVHQLRRNSCYIYTRPPPPQTMQQPQLNILRILLI